MLGKGGNRLGYIELMGVKFTKLTSCAGVTKK